MALNFGISMVNYIAITTSPLRYSQMALNDGTIMVFHMSNIKLNFSFFIIYIINERMPELFTMVLPKELWELISTDNPTTYYKLLQVSRAFKLDTDMMKAKFIRKTVYNDNGVDYKLPCGWLHSCNDQPAKIYANGTQRWYIDGKLHRDNDQPTTIHANGTRQWYINGKKHRDNDQPAEIWADGQQVWYIDGNRHRDNDLPAVIADSVQCWYIDGKRHRGNDQPATIHTNRSVWYHNGELHRDNNKPAVIFNDGRHYWYIDGKRQHDNKSAMADTDDSLYWLVERAIYDP